MLPQSYGSVSSNNLGITNSGISNQPREIYSICICYCNSTRYKRKLNSGLPITSSYIDIDCQFMGICQGIKANLDLSVVTFISISMSYSYSSIYVVKEHLLYSGTWNKKTLLACVRLSCEVCTIRIKEEVDEKRCTVGTNRNADCLLKNMAMKQNKCYQSKTRAIVLSD